MKNHCQDFLWRWGHSCPRGSSSWGYHYSSHLARAFLASPSSYARVGGVWRAPEMLGRTSLRPRGRQRREESCGAPGRCSWPELSSQTPPHAR